MAQQQTQSVEIINSKEEFDEKIKNYTGKVVIVDFHAAWCGPCKMIGPKVKEYANTTDKVVLLTVDVDECDDIAAESGINAMPTFHFYVNGKKEGDLVGANIDKLKAQVEELLSKC